MRNVYITWANRTASTPSDGQGRPVAGLTDLFLQIAPQPLTDVARIYYCNRYVVSDEFVEHELIPQVVAALRGEAVPGRHLEFDPRRFAEEARALALLEQGRFLHEYSGTLGGLNMLQQVIHALQTSHDDESVLLFAGESLDPRKLDAFQRRQTFNHRAALAQPDEDIGLTSISSHALLADAALRSDPDVRSQEDVADLMRTVALHREKYARLNPRSYQCQKGQQRVTRDWYRENDDRRRKWPFATLDICPVNVGASALKLANHTHGEGTHVRISTPHIAAANVEIPIRERYERPTGETREAWTATCREIGFTGDDQRLLLELFDTYGIQIPMTLLAMGALAGRTFLGLNAVRAAFAENFFDPIDDEVIDVDGKQVRGPVDIRPECRVLLNPSGGTKEGYTNGGYALAKAVELYWLLTGDPNAVWPLAAERRPRHAVLSVIGGTENSTGFLGFVAGEGGPA